MKIQKLVAIAITFYLTSISVQAQLDPNTEIKETTPGKSFSTGETNPAGTLLADPKAQDVAMVDAKLTDEIAQPFVDASTQFRVDCAGAQT